MMVRTQIALDADAHRRAKRRAADRGISLAEYVRQAVDRDLGEQPRGNITEIFGLFDSGRSDIANHKDEYIGEAVWQEHLSSTGQPPR